MLATTCHCGAVRIEIPRRPRAMTNCSCSICRHYGTLWPYYASTDVTIIAVSGATTSYAWGVKSIRFVRCDTCGCVTHWKPATEACGLRRGVHLRNFHPSQLGPVRMRCLDGDVTERSVEGPR